MLGRETEPNLIRLATTTKHNKKQRNNNNQTMDEKKRMKRIAGLENEFRRLGLSLVGLPVKKGSSIALQNRRFRAHYGNGWKTVAFLWEAIVEVDEEMNDGRPTKLQKKHLLWCLYFMKTYSTEDDCSGRFDTTAKTFRKWAWDFIKKIAFLLPFYVSVLFCFQYAHFFCFFSSLLLDQTRK